MCIVTNFSRNISIAIQFTLLCLFFFFSAHRVQLKFYRKVSPDFIHLIILSSSYRKPSLHASTTVPECHNSQFNQVDLYHVTSHQRLIPRKHLFNNTGYDFIHVIILLVKYVGRFSLWVTPVDLCNIWKVLYMCFLWSTLLFFPP